MGRKLGANTIWPGPRPTCMPSFILIHATVRPQYTNVTDRQVCDVGVLWPNGCMDQDETWHAGRPRPWPHSVKWGPISPPPKGGGAPNFRPISVVAKWLHVSRCHFIWRKDLPRRLCVRWGPSFPPQKGGRVPLPNFRPMSIVAKRLDGSKWHLAWGWALVYATLC